MEDVIIKSYYSIYEAEVAKEFLKEKGIKSVIQSGMTLSGGLNTSLPEFKLFVMKENAERAIEILKIEEMPAKEKYVPVRKRLYMKSGVIALIIFLLLLYFIPKIFDFLNNLGSNDITNNSVTDLLNNNYSFKSISEGDPNKQQYLDYSVEVYKNQQLTKKISISHDISLVAPTFFVLSPDQRYVAFKTASYGGTCVYHASPTIIDLSNFSIVNLDRSDINKKLENALEIDPGDPKNNFSAVREIKNIKWISNDKIEATMKFGDESGCSIEVYPKPVNFPEAIELKVNYTIIK